MKTKRSFSKTTKTTSCGALAWRLRAGGGVDFLLIKQFAHKDSWGIPKGHLDPGETLEQCAVREVKEETGVTVSLEQKLAPAFIRIFKEEKTVHAWLATVVGSDEPRHDDPDSEVADARWWDAEALPEVHVYQRALISEAIDKLNQRLALAGSATPDRAEIVAARAKVFASLVGERKKLVHPKVADALHHVYSYASSTDDWAIIKREVMKNLSWQLRAEFSTRDAVTGADSLNDMEKQLAACWCELTGRQILVNSDGTSAKPLA